MVAYQCTDCGHVRPTASATCPQCGSGNAINAAATGVIPASRFSSEQAPAAGSASGVEVGASLSQAEVISLLRDLVAQQKRLVAAQEASVANTSTIKLLVFIFVFASFAIPFVFFLLNS
jgi:hypothetical protein